MKQVHSYLEEDSKRDEIEEEKQCSIIFKEPCEVYNASVDEVLDEDLAELPNSHEEQVITFQNVNFVFKLSRTTPVEMDRGDDLP